MADDVIFETSGANNIRPKESVAAGTNLVPKPTEGGNFGSIGTEDDRWTGVNAHEGNFELENTTGKKFFTVSTPNGAAMVRVVGDGDRVFLGFDVVSSTTQGRVHSH